jgi:hypothetical protein
MSEDNEVSVGIGERIRASFRESSPGTARNVDRHLSLNLPEYIEKHNLALKNELVDVEDTLKDREVRVGDLEKWQVATKDKIDETRERVERMEKKHGISTR